MLTGIDHIIIGVNDLEQASNRYEQQLGLVASGGGIHPVGGTANRIIVIGDTYLELITVRTPEEAQKSMLDHLAKGDGYLNCVFASNDIWNDSADIVRRHVPIVGPNQGELRSDQRSRGWVRTDVERPDLTQHYPFLIQHDSNGEERRQRLAGWTTPPTHPLGAISILSVTVAVKDLSEAPARFQRIYGLQPSATFTENGWDARLVAFTLGNGEQRFELAAPPSATAGEEQETIGEKELPAAGALASFLARFEENVCRMTLAVADLQAARDFLTQHHVVHTYREDTTSSLWIHPSQANGAAIVLRGR